MSRSTELVRSGMTGEFTDTEHAIKIIKELEAQVVKEQDAGMEMLSRITELEAESERWQLEMDEACMKVLKTVQSNRELERPDCKWKPPTDDWYGNTWSGSCGTEWSLEADGPKENNMNFCPECGGRLIIEEQSDELGI